MFIKMMKGRSQFNQKSMALFVSRARRRLPHVEQVVFTLPELLGSSPGFGGVKVISLWILGCVLHTVFQSSVSFSTIKFECLYYPTPLFQKNLLQPLSWKHIHPFGTIYTYRNHVGWST